MSQQYDCGDIYTVRTTHGVHLPSIVDLNTAACRDKTSTSTMAQTELGTRHVDNHNNNNIPPQEIMADIYPAAGAQRQGRCKKRHRKSKKPKETATVEPYTMFEICILTPGKECLPLLQFTVEQIKQSAPCSSDP